MHMLMKTAAVAATVVGFALVSSSALSQGDDKPKQEPPNANPVDKEAREKARLAKLDAFAKAFATNKLPLSEAIAIAEKERKGKAHGADVNVLKDGKLQIEVRLIGGEKADKWEEVFVDPVTKAVTRAPMHDEGEEEEGEHR